MKKLTSVIASLLCVQLCLTAPGFAQSAPARGQAAQRGLTAETQKRLRESLAKAEAYLKSQQRPDGLWDNHPGVNALAATAILRQPGASRATQLGTVGKALDAFAKLSKPDGGIYEKTTPHYITAVSAVALVAGGRPQDKPVIEKARKYLTENLLDESEGVNPNDIWYGGMGYGATTRADGRRADMISLEFAMRAMKETGVPENDAAWKKALVVVHRENESRVGKELIQEIYKETGFKP